MADQAGLTPERPHSPDSEASIEDRRKKGKKQEQMLLDWNQLTGSETVPVINRLTGKKVILSLVWMAMSYARVAVVNKSKITSDCNAYNVSHL